MQRTRTAGLVVSLICAIWRVSAADLPIVLDGQPAATIVVPAQADEWTRKAAEWVRDYVKQSTGAALPILPEEQAPSAPLISVGRTRLAQAAGVSAEDLRWDGCRMVVKGNVLYLIGHDDPMGPNEWGGSNIGPKGTCRAATLFLEDVVGVRWFLPVREGHLVPNHRTLAVPAALNKTFVPAFAFCHGRYPYGYGTPASIANNYRTAVKVMTAGGHTYYLWLSAEKYFDEHPEYFALIGGRRIKQGNHLCSTNPQVRQILLAELRKALDAGWDWVALGQEDGYQRCQCPDCEKLDAFRDFAPYGWAPREGETWDEFVAQHSQTPCERLLLLHKWLIDECAKSHPNKKIHILLYGPSLFPPKTFERLGDNVVGEVAFYHDRLDYAVLDMWKDRVNALTVMCTWFDLTGGSGVGMGVMMTPREVARKIREYHKRNVIGLYGIHQANWGLQGPSFYVQGKLVGDPSLDPDALVGEYCRGLYGVAAGAMKDFFDLLYSRSPRRLGLLEMSGRLLSPAETHLMVYTPAFIRQLEPMLARAESAAARDTETVRRLIALTRLHFDYLKLLTNMEAAHTAWQASESPDTLARLQEHVEAFEAYRMKVITCDDPALTELPGYDWLCLFLVGGGQDVNYYKSWAKRRAELDLSRVRGMVCGFSGSAIRKPLTLDFAKAAQKKASAQMIVRRVPAGPKLDGILDRAEWGTAEPVSLRPLTVGAVETTTTVRAVYDHDSLYLAFECAEPLPDKMKLQAVGRDGNVWALDHVEFFFDPEDSRRRRYQFMVAPHAEASYDARIGFKTISDEDAGWNADWDYAFRITPDAKQWTVEVRIPFKGLGVSVPNDGDTLRGNFARARYAGGGHDPDCSLWSHGETLGFSDPTAFGTLVFEHILY